MLETKFTTIPVSSNKPYFHYFVLLLGNKNIWNNTTTINNFPLGVLNFKLSATFMLSFSYNSPLSKRFSDSLKYSSFPRWEVSRRPVGRIISCYRQSHRRTVIEIHFVALNLEGTTSHDGPLSLS
jgi:hypothetical protein